MAPAEELVHLRQQSGHPSAQFIGKGDVHPPAGLTVKEGSLWYSAAEHLFQAHGLGTQLEQVGIVGLGAPPFVFYRKGVPETFFTLKRDTGRIGVEFHYIAFSGEPQCPRYHRETPEDQNIAPPLPQLLIMGPAVEECTLHGAQILLPLLLDVDEGPLAAAEGKVLQSGELEEILLRIDHPIR